MTGTTTGDWRSALTAVEQGIGECLAALDRYEAAFAKVLDDRLIVPKAAATPPPIDWDDRLKSSREVGDEVERVLAEQEEVWGRWRSSLAQWQTLVAAR